jgi:hypothetical protein
MHSKIRFIYAYKQQAMLMCATMPRIERMRIFSANMPRFGSYGSF